MKDDIESFLDLLREDITTINIWRHIQIIEDELGVYMDRDKVDNPLTYYRLLKRHDHKKIKA